MSAWKRSPSTPYASSAGKPWRNACGSPPVVGNATPADWIARSGRAAAAGRRARRRRSRASRSGASQPGGTVVSLLRKTTTSPVACARARLLPSAKPWFSALWWTCTRGHLSAGQRSSAAATAAEEPLSQTMTSTSLGGLGRQQRLDAGGGELAVVVRRDDDRRQPGVGVRASSAAQSTRCRLSTTRRQSPGGGRSARRRSGNRRRTPMLGTCSTSVPWRIRKSSGQAAGRRGRPGPAEQRLALGHQPRRLDVGRRRAKTTLSPLPRSPSSPSATTAGPARRAAPAGPAPRSRRRRGTRRTPPSPRRGR